MDFPFKLPMILDGATGVRLSELGRPASACPELWTVENPWAIAQVQRGYAEAGSDAVLAATFGANRHKLKQYGLEDRVAELNRELVSVSREAVGEGCLVGADISALGLFLKPMGEGELEDFISIYREQMEALEDAGVDFYVIETMMTLAEIRAAFIAIREVSAKPILVMVTLDEGGRMLSGGSALATMVALQALGAAAFGLNCSSGPAAMLDVIRGMAPYARVPLILKPNAGVPEVVDGKTVFKLTPEDFVRDIGEFAANGVRIFGGCCGTDERFIAALREALKTVAFGDAEKVEGEFLASEREIFPAGVEFDVRLTADEDLEDELMDCGDCEGLEIFIPDEAGLRAFTLAQYLINRPLKLTAANKALLTAALRAYNGRALAEINAYGALVL